MLLGLVEDDRGLGLGVGQLILQVLIIFEEFAYRERFVGEIDTKFVAVSCQTFDVPDHGDAIHGALSELVVLLRKFVVLPLEIADAVFQARYSVQVGLDSLFNFLLKVSITCVGKLREGEHLCPQLVLHAQR